MHHVCTVPEYHTLQDKDIRYKTAFGYADLERPGKIWRPWIVGDFKKYIG